MTHRARTTHDIIGLARSRRLAAGLTALLTIALLLAGCGGGNATNEGADVGPGEPAAVVDENGAPAEDAGEAAPPRPTVLPPTEAPIPTAVPTPEPDLDTSGLPATEVIVFEPSYQEGEEQVGSCWTRSMTVARAGAWRCQSADQIYDPCFSLPDDPNAVVCGAQPPDEPEGFKLNLTEPLPPASGSGRASAALALELADGTRCGLSQGATVVLEGERANYACDDESVILGRAVPGDVWVARRVWLADGEDEDPTIDREAWVALTTVWQ